MRTLKIILSDLHVGNGDTLLDGFGARQQAALEGLLRVASRDVPFDEEDDVELIVNGDGFDFLMAEPFDTGGVTDAALAGAKLQKIAAAHAPFFRTLHRFLRQPRRRITFLAGNHDIELCFAEVQAGIREAIGLKPNDERVSFSTHCYRPLPDIYLEHGHAYDFWCCDRSRFSEASGQQGSVHQQTVTLPLGSQYVQHAGYPVLARYPYLSLFEPSLSIPRQVALFCVLNPAVVVELIQHVQELIDAWTPDQPHQEAPQLLPGAEGSTVMLFEQAMLALLAFQQRAAARSPGWKDILGEETALHTQVQTMTEITLLRDMISTVAEGEQEGAAIAAICTPTPDLMDDRLVLGMQTMLQVCPSLRYTFAGHTHRIRFDPLQDGSAERQVYVNTASWLARLALPAPEEVTPELVAWLRAPDREQIPLLEVPPRCVFALIDAAPGEAAHAQLCIWEGGRNGRYRMLAE